MLTLPRPLPGDKPVGPLPVRTPDPPESDRSATLLVRLAEARDRRESLLREILAVRHSSGHRGYVADRRRELAATRWWLAHLRGLIDAGRSTD